MAEEKYYLEGVGGQLSVYEDRIVIGRKGFYGTLYHGFSGDKTIPMNSITSVQYKRATTQPLK